MIKGKDGHVRSERTPEEYAEMLREEIANLSPDERETLLLCLRELDDPAIRERRDAADGGGPTRIFDALYDGEYIRPMVDIETFVKDPYYLGETCSNIYPKLLEDMVELFDGGYREVILTGSIGYGKTFFASIALCRVLYEISCLRDPHRSFGLAKDSNIALVGISISEALAIKVVFENVATKLAQSPYFKENYAFEATKKELRFPKKVWVAALSTTDTAALGLNVLGGIMDEGNFYEPMNRGKAAQAKYGNKDKSQFLYDQLVRRMKSRFNNKGKLPGLMAVVSSKRTKDDFTARRIRESANDPEVFVRDYSTWEVAPDKFSSKMFQVLVGNETIPSRILEENEVVAMKGKIADTGDDNILIVNVPEDFKNDFENDIDGAIRDIAGVETVSISPFIHQRDKIELCIDPNRLHPFEVIEWDQSKPGSFIWERVSHMTKVRDGAEVFEAWQPLFYPGYTRHVHIDPSLNNDCTGICLGCIIGYKQIERRNRDTQELYVESAPIIWIDFMLRIKPPVGGEIDHGMIRGIVYQFQNHGFPVGLVTMDQFNSAASLQKFRVKGMDAEVMSVDRPMDAYDTLKAALYEGRIMMYKYEPVLEELRKLQQDKIKNKVDHPRHGSKDVADALAGVTYSLTAKAHPAPMMILKGISKHGDPNVDKDMEVIENSDFFMPFLTG